MEINIGGFLIFGGNMIKLRLKQSEVQVVAILAATWLDQACKTEVQLEIKEAVNFAKKVMPVVVKDSREYKMLEKAMLGVTQSEMNPKEK